MLDMTNHLKIGGFVLNRWRKYCIWGYKEPNHTHHWIHAAYYKALKYLGANVVWLDDHDLLVDLHDTLVITEGQVDKNLPIVDDCFYVTLNSSRDYPRNRRLWIQTYTDACLKYNVREVAKGCFFDGECLFQCWATDS